MDLAEKSFGVFWKWGTRWRQKMSDFGQEGVYLRDESATLEYLIAAIVGRPVSVRPLNSGLDVGRGSGGGLINDILVLPDKIQIAVERDSNRLVYLYRTIFSGLSCTKGLVLAGDEAADESGEKLDDDQLRFLSCCAAPNIDTLIGEKFPDFAKRWKCLAAAFVSENPVPPDIASDMARISELPAADFFSEAKLLWQKINGKSPRQRSSVRASLQLDHPRWGAIPVQTGRQSSSAAVLPPALTARQKRDGLDDSTDGPGDNHGELDGPCQTQPKVCTIETDQTPPNPVTNLFEQLLTVDNYRGGHRRVDGSDELEEHADALRSLDIREVTRAGETVESYYKADLPSLATTNTDYYEPVPAAAKLFHYHEWDPAFGGYRRDYCAVTEFIVPHSVMGDDAGRECGVRDLNVAGNSVDKATNSRRDVRNLTATIAKAANTYRYSRDQTDGEDIDTNAVVRHFADTISGRRERARVFLRKDRDQHDTAVTLLLDGSLSADSWLRGRKILDIEKEATYLFMEASRDHLQKVEVASFYSNTHRDCRYFVHKAFEESWSDAKAKIHQITANGYTRLGPAVRHATHRLTGISARKRVLLVLTDGKPTDFDAYEGQRGIRDVRQSIREATAAKVSVFGISMQADGNRHLGLMFGLNGFTQLRNREDMGTAMKKAVTHLF